MSNNKYTTIGGQALIEGIMMRGPKLSSMTLRLASGETETTTWKTFKDDTPPKITKIPFLRGIYNMVNSLYIGMKCLGKSAEKTGEVEEPSKFEMALAKSLNMSIENISMLIAGVVGFGLAILLFIIAPTYISSLITLVTKNPVIIAICEGIMKFIIFIAYLYIISMNNEITRVLQYHGAEHKTIACFEAGAELTPENCAKFSRLHPRCGTSFLLIIVVLSIIVGSLIPTTNATIRVLIKLLLLPLLIGGSYEIIRLTGKFSGMCSRFVAAPGLWVQKLTTKEPDYKQLEVAIEAMKAVLPSDKAEAYD